jgi:hypothetical protein
MELKWGHICVDARFDSFGADIVSLLTGFGADPGMPLKLDLPAHIAFRLFLSSEAEVSGKELYAFLTDKNDEPVGDPFQAEVSVVPVGSDRSKYPLVGGGKIRLDNRPLPPIGAYSMNFYLGDATLLGRVPVTISPRQGKHETAKLQDSGPVRLAWAHMMIDLKQTDTGLFNLIGIFEFIPPTSNKGVNLKDWVVLVQIEADPTIHINRKLRAELLDSDNRPAKDASGRIVTPAHRPITLRRFSMGSDLLVSMAPIRFKEDIWVPPGNYRFNFQLDGTELGDLKIVALPSFPPP